MVSDIARMLHAPGFRGIDPHAGFPAHPQAHLPRQRPRLRTIYESYAEMNGLKKFDRHQELGLIEVFASALDSAFGEYQNPPFGSPTIPDWRRIEVALDGILPELVNAFENRSGASDRSRAGQPLALVRLERPQGACLTVRRLVILEGIFVAMVSCVIDRGYSCSSSQQW